MKQLELKQSQFQSNSIAHTLKQNTQNKQTRWSYQRTPGGARIKGHGLTAHPTRMLYRRQRRRSVQSRAHKNSASQHWKRHLSHSKAAASNFCKTNKDVFIYFLPTPLPF